ncbi:MAG: NUDIX hydrolase [Acidimicrobiales bacterium]
MVVGYSSPPLSALSDGVVCRSGCALASYDDGWRRQASRDQPDGMRHWCVAGAALRIDEQVLVVQNKRRNGLTDWSTPGGVIDDGERRHSKRSEARCGKKPDSWLRGGANRSTWSGRRPEFGFKLDVVTFEAVSFSGDIVLDDPDGIVIEAEFVSPTAVERMAAAPIWVAEPFGVSHRGCGRWPSLRVPRGGSITGHSGR